MILPKIKICNPLPLENSFYPILDVMSTNIFSFPIHILILTWKDFSFELQVCPQ